MFRFGFLFRFLLALLVIGGLVAGGVAIYRLGWVQGYQASILLSNKTAAPAAPYYGYPIMPFYPAFGFPFFLPLFGIGFFLLFLFVIGGLLRFGMHRRWAEHPGAGRWEGHGGPWGWEGKERSKEQGEKGGESKEDSKESSH